MRQRLWGSVYIRDGRIRARLPRVHGQMGEWLSERSVALGTATGGRSRAHADRGDAARRRLRGLLRLRPLPPGVVSPRLGVPPEVAAAFVP